eukprot:gene32011-41513_t
MLRAGDSIHTLSSVCPTDNALYKLFREKPCVDMTSFEVDIHQCDELYDHSTYVYVNTVVGRHFAWFRQHMPSVDHLTAKRYAAILTSHKVETTVRLWSVLQADPTFLQTYFEISNEAAELIKKTFENVKAIDGLIEQQRQKFLRAIEVEHADAVKYMDTAIYLVEAVEMSKEDSLAHTVREKSNSATAAENFAIMKETMHEQYEQFLVRLSQEKKIQEAIRICSISSLKTALDILSTPHDIYEDDFSISGNRKNDVSKANKVKAFISSAGKEELLELLQESAYIFHGMVKICIKGKAESVYKMILNRVVNLTMSIMANAYMFAYTFESPHVPDLSFRRLRMPVEGLRAMKHMCNNAQNNLSDSLEDVEGNHHHKAHHHVAYNTKVAAHALLNVVYGSDDNKMYCAQQHIHDFFLPPIKANIETIVAYYE